MSIKRLLFSGIVLLWLIPNVYSQEAKFKALFMYNFTKYIEWPASKQQGNFVIGVFGPSPIISELEIIAQKKKVGTQTIVVKQVDNPADGKNCHILFVPEGKSSKIEELAANCSGNGVVIIGDKAGLAKTVAGLNYITVDGKQSFEVSKGNLEKQGVKVNSVLLSLGVVVD